MHSAWTVILLTLRCLVMVLNTTHGFIVNGDVVVAELAYMAPVTGPVDGGEKMIMIFKDLVIDPDKPMPRIKFEKEVFSSFAKDKEFRVINYTSEVVDFRKYQLMEKEDNQKLIDEWCKPPWVLVEVDTTEVDRLGVPLSMDIFLMHNGLLTKLYKPCELGQEPNGYTTEGYTCKEEALLGQTKVSWLMHFHVHPSFTDMYPQLGPSQGGTEITVHGSNYPIIDPRMDNKGPMIKVHCDDADYQLDVQSFGASHFSFLTPPQIVNETDFYARSSVYISFNRQRFYLVPYEYIQHDPSPIHWGDAIALAHIQAKEFVLTAGEKVKSRTTKHHVVTAMQELSEDTDKFFVIREPLPVQQGGPEGTHKSHAMSADGTFQYTGRVAAQKPDGQPIACNSTIRLWHVRTDKFLSSYFYNLPDSHEQEVYLNGIDGVGDTDDNWIVQCEHNTRHGYSWMWDYIANEYNMFTYNKPLQQYRIQWMLDNNNIFWRPTTVIRLFHPNSGKYLAFNNIDVTARACPYCYKNQHKEVTTTDFTTKGDSQRFFVKRQTRMVIECSRTDEVLTKRWRVFNRDLRIGDFVVWRNASVSPCDVTGPHAVKYTNFKMDTRFGKVLEMYKESAVVYVEEYEERAQIYSRTTRQYTSTPWQATHALSISSVHGPLQIQDEDAQGAALGANRRWVKVLFENSMDYQRTAVD